jgi:hypothetical protein
MPQVNFCETISIRDTVAGESGPERRRLPNLARTASKFLVRSIRHV